MFVVTYNKKRNTLKDLIQIEFGDHQTKNYIKTIYPCKVPETQTEIPFYATPKVMVMRSRDGRREPVKALVVSNSPNKKEATWEFSLNFGQSKSNLFKMVV